MAFKSVGKNGLLLLLLRCALAEVPASKNVLGEMFVIIRQHIAWNNWSAWSKAMKPIWAPNFTYDFVQPLGKTHGLRQWYEGEHLHYNEAFPNFRSYNFLYLGTDDASSLQSYHVVRWKGAFGGVPAPPGEPLIKVKDMDFYTMQDNQILYNWCMVDMIAILQQGGYEVLPPAPMPNGIDYLPPRAMDGIPAPDDDYATQEDADKAKAVVTAMLQEDFVQQNTEANWWIKDLMWCGPGGIGHARSREEYVQHFLKPFHAAFSNPVLKVDKFVCESNYCGVHFHLQAVHSGTWLGAQATGLVVSLRFGTHFRVVFDKAGRNRIADAWVQLDIVDAFSQIGIDLIARARAQYPSLLKQVKATSTEAIADTLTLSEGEARPMSDEHFEPLDERFASRVYILVCCCIASFGAILTWRRTKTRQVNVHSWALG